MEDFNVFLAVTYLSDNSDLEEVAAIVKDPEWHEQARQSQALVVGTLLVLTGIYGLTSRNILHMSASARQAVSEIREAFDEQTASPVEHRCLRIIYGMDGLGLTDASGKEADRELRKCYRVREELRATPWSTSAVNAIASWKNN